MVDRRDIVEFALQNRVRSEEDLTASDLHALVWNKFVENLTRAHIDPNKCIGHSELTEEPDGSITARITFVQQNPR